MCDDLSWMCQSPIYRDTHFYNFYGGGKNETHCSVNPLSIGTPISTVRTRRYYGLHRACVNPLSIGTPISTMELPEKSFGKLNVSIPIYRDTHFYDLEHEEKTFICPVSIPYLSGHPFLPTRSSCAWQPPSHCVNPLSIGTPISTFCCHPPPLGTFYSVSIPYLSGHPFLPGILRKNRCWNRLCQSPIYRDTHFYGGGAK